MAREVSVIAIDGPVAAGKTVVGRALAHELGFGYLDTGVMYRAITWLALQRGTPIDESGVIGELASANPVHLVDNNSARIVVAGHELGPELREQSVESKVSLVSRISSVRRALVEQQRGLAAQSAIVMIGRDIGTVVLPSADLKIYLTASPESRARRRWLEMVDAGRKVELDEVLEETRSRDHIDTSRADSPLRPADDAWVLDTEDLTVEQVVERIVGEIAAQNQRNGA
ncbi:MAG: cytidylate kinase [SAR202 cluster bacterium Io17-Chloro-G9]|nr:MAG: cytidylate kinase [SAR202 cluster bacterium Io17-Chloro-G9]